MFIREWWFLLVLPVAMLCVAPGAFMWPVVPAVSPEIVLFTDNYFTGTRLGEDPAFLREVLGKDKSAQARSFRKAFTKDSRVEYRIYPADGKPGYTVVIRIHLDGLGQFYAWRPWPHEQE